MRVRKWGHEPRRSPTGTAALGARAGGIQRRAAPRQVPEARRVGERKDAADVPAVGTLRPCDVRAVRVPVPERTARGGPADPPLSDDRRHRAAPPEPASARYHLHAATTPVVDAGVSDRGGPRPASVRRVRPRRCAPEGHRRKDARRSRIRAALGRDARRLGSRAAHPPTAHGRGGNRRRDERRRGQQRPPDTRRRRVPRVRAGGRVRAVRLRQQRGRQVRADVYAGARVGPRLLWKQRLVRLAQLAAGAGRHGTGVQSRRGRVPRSRMRGTPRLERPEGHAGSLLGARTTLQGKRHRGGAPCAGRPVDYEGGLPRVLRRLATP